MEVTTSGKPPKIERVWFRARYGQSFPDLLAEEKNDILDTCINDVYTLFYGVADSLPFIIFFIINKNKKNTP